MKARHAFRDGQVDVAVGLLRVYFCQSDRSTQNNLWDEKDRNEFYGLFSDQSQLLDFDQAGWWNTYSGDDRYNPGGKLASTGILGDRSLFIRDKDLELEKVYQAVNNWIINLAKVGFHLCSNT